MDLEEKPGFDKDINSSARANSGTFSIESILKTGGFRCVAPVQPEFQSIPSMIRPAAGLSPEDVKKEEVEEVEESCMESMRRLPGPGQPSLASDTAACHDDSGEEVFSYSDGSYSLHCPEDEDGLGDDRKKRPRTAFTAAQIKALESEFEKNKYLSVSKRMQLSKQLKLTETQVETSVAVKLSGKTKYFFLDKNLVSKSTDQVEAKVHERPGAGGPAVLLDPGDPGPKAHVHRRQAVVRPSLLAVSC